MAILSLGIIVDEFLAYKLQIDLIDRCHILKLKYTKFDFGWGCAPDPAGGAHSALPDP